MVLIVCFLLMVAIMAYPSYALPPDLKADVVVSHDATGDVQTIGEAIDRASNRQGTRRFVIYVKSGTYNEYVLVSSSLPNITLVGDGIGRTIITGDHCVQDGQHNTYNSSTVAVDADDFIARDLTIRNTAGPDGGQAVALRLGGDRSIIFRCSIEGFQDTLCAYKMRQFYRECDISGTVDFIFGYATAVFQYCNISVRASPQKTNVITAHGRGSAVETTGYSIQNSYVRADGWNPKQQPDVKTYLGRPWGSFSRTIFMDSTLDFLIDPDGWMPMGNDTSTLSTLYYAEYNNNGDGSRTDHRVRWPGYKVITNSTEAEQFTVENFIDGNTWLPETGIPFKPGF